MISFIGTYSSKVDDKGRVVFPSGLKSQMPEGADMRFVLHKDIHSKCLEMYTFEEWQRQSEGIKSKLNSLDPRHAAFWRGYMQFRALVVPDPKAEERKRQRERAARLKEEGKKRLEKGLDLLEGLAEDE